MVTDFPYVSLFLAFLSGIIVGGWVMVFILAGRPRSEVTDDNEDITGIGA